MKLPGDIAAAGVTLGAAFLVGQGLFILFRLSAARDYLLGFAETLARHLVEQLLRLAFGVCLLLAAGVSSWPLFFNVFGALLIGTSVLLLILPWRWHRRFARWVMPGVVRIAWLYAVLSLALGVFLFMLLHPWWLKLLA